MIRDQQGGEEWSHGHGHEKKRSGSQALLRFTIKRVINCKSIESVRFGSLNTFCSCVFRSGRAPAVAMTLLQMQ